MTGHDLNSEASVDAIVAPQKLTRGSLVITATRVFTVLLAYFLNAFLARQLGPDLFGLLGAVITVLAWLELVVAEGLPTWVTRATTSTEDLKGALPASYLGAQLVLSLALTTFMVLAAPWLARVMGAPDSASLFRIAAIDIPIFGFYVLFGSVLLGAGLYTVHAATNAAYYIAKLAFTFAFVSMGLSVTGAVLGSVSASVVGLVVTALLLLTSHAAATRHARRATQTTSPDAYAAAVDPALGAAAEKPEHTARDVVEGSVTPALLLLLQALMFSVAMWLLRALAAPEQAGYYRAASLIAQVPVDISAGFTWALYAAYSTAFARGDQVKCRHYLSQAIRLLIVAGVLWVAVIVPTAKPLLTLLFSAPFAEAAPALVALSMGLLPGTVALVLAPTLIVRGHSRVLLTGAVVIVAAQVTAIVALAPTMGTLGAAIATGGAIAAGGLGMLMLVWRDLDFNFWSVLARTLVPGLAVVALGLLVPISQPIYLLGWYPVLAAVFAVGLWLSRGITRADLDSLKEGLK